MDLSEFSARLDDRLRTADYADVDASANGLQVGDDGAVEHVAFAVDAAAETIERAVEVGSDVLVTHHGLVWGGLERVTGRTYGRIEPLVRNDLALYVSHLPLDGHQELGNAAGLADLLSLAEREPFGDVGGEPVGLRGRVREQIRLDDLAGRLDEELDTGGASVTALDFGPDPVEEVAIVTGAGADFLDDAVDADADVLVTGEGKGRTYHEAKEAGIGVLLAGHYATETFGVRRLRAVVADWGLETTFVDAPTGL